MKPVLFFDVDGTLVDTKKNEVPKSAIDAIKHLQSLGYLCCVATGRIYTNFQKNVAYNALKWDGYVCGNGLQVLDGEGNYLLNDAYTPELVNKIHEIVKGENHTCCIFTDEAIHMLDKPNQDAIDALAFLNEKVPETIEYDNRIVRTMMIFAPVGYDYKIYDQQEEVIAIPSYVSYCDLVLSSVSKSKGIKVFLENTGNHEYIAFGDSMNDYDMLENADVSIAMGQAPEQIKKLVDYVSDPVDQEGLANAIKRWILKEAI